MKVITGTWQDGAGNPVANGRVFFKLSQDAVVIGTAQVAPSLFSITLNSSGQIPANTSIWANDELTPTGTTYTVAVLASGGGLIWGAESVLLSGASPINLNTAIPTTLNVVVPDPVLKNPAGGALQTIAGPLTINGVLSAVGTQAFGDGAVNQQSIANIGSLNFLSEFQLAEGNHGTVEAVAGGIVIPNTATALQSEAVAGYVTNSSTITGGFGGYFQCRSVANSTFCGGINPVAFDTAGLTTGVKLYGSDLVVAARNATTAYSIIIGYSSSLNATQAGNFGQAFDANVGAGTGAGIWNFAFRSRDASAATAFLAGALCSTGTCSSQPITLSAYSSNVLVTGNIALNQFSQFSFNQTIATTAGIFVGTEVAAPSGNASQDILYADSTAHRWKMNNNNGGADSVVGAATTDTFTNKTYDTAGSGNSFKINGQSITAVSGANSTVIVAGADINTSGQVTVTHLAAALPTNQGGTGQIVASTFPSTAGAIPSAFSCGTTTTCGNTALGNTARIIFGSCPFSASTTCTVSGITAFTSSSSYLCVVTEASNTGVTFKVANVSSSSFTITASGSNSDTVNYHCVGN